MVYTHIPTHSFSKKDLENKIDFKNYKWNRRENLNT